jgi:hypothetical protein
MRAALCHQLQVHGERPVFRLGDLSVDRVRRIVRVRDHEVKLSPKEYDLLRVLVQHAGKALHTNSCLANYGTNWWTHSIFAFTCVSSGRRLKPIPNARNIFSRKPASAIDCARPTKD